MTVEQMIQFLRTSVYVQDKDGAVTQDSQYLCMTDEDLLTYLNVALTRNFSDIPSLQYLPQEAVFPVVLLAKKELYYTLAVKEAPLFDIGADNNNYLKRSQRFDHYMKLIAQVDSEYKDWLENGGTDNGVVKSYSVTLSDRYSTRYNYEHAESPTVTLYVGTITEDTVEFWWSVKNLSRFSSYKVYVSKNPIVDLYDLKSHISSEAKLVTEIKDIRQLRCRLTGLEQKTKYYIAVQVIEMSTISGYAEVQIETGPFDTEELPVEPDTESVTEEGGDT